MVFCCKFRIYATFFSILEITDLKKNSKNCKTHAIIGGKIENWLSTLHASIDVKTEVIKVEKLEKNQINEPARVKPTNKPINKLELKQFHSKC